MRAVRVHTYREPPRIDELPPPGSPARGHLSVEVAAVGVGSWDVGVAAGRLKRFVVLEPPFVMGAELAGRVAAVGPDVEGFMVGDRIIANPGIIGAWAEHTNIKAATCGPAPASVDDGQAAALPVGAVTALQALDMLALEPGASLLILGAGGSVGRAAIQLGRVRGLHVLALVPEWELEGSRHLGADQAIDQAGDWSTQLQSSVDGALDLIGGEVLARSAGVLRPGGRAVTTVADSMSAPVAASLSMAYLRMRSTTADLAAVAAHVDAGELTMPVRVRLPVEDVDGALADVEAGLEHGKHVLEF